MSDKALQVECAKADLIRALEKHCGATAVIEDGGDAEGIFMSLLSGVGNGHLYGAAPLHPRRSLMRGRRQLRRVDFSSPCAPVRPTHHLARPETTWTPNRWLELQQ